MKRYGLVMLVLAGALVAGGCAAPNQGVNYGHPALNAAAAANQPQVPRADTGRIALGALAGGLIGSRFGRGDGRVAATGAGAAIGAMLAQGDGMSGEGAGRAQDRMFTGALLGGLAGSRFGSGSGQLAATAIGVGLGAYLAAPPK